MARIIMIGKYQKHKTCAGFTLVELLLVLFVITLLASIVTPIVTTSITRARESTLREDLHVMRKAIDDYYADHGKYPESLSILAEKHYIRKVPIDPITERNDSWIVETVPSHNGVRDVRSGSNEVASDGTIYQTW